MKLLILVILCATCIVNYSYAQTSCQNIGDMRTFLDPTCAQGGVGCNAGGQGQLCRFCGPGFVDCPPDTTTARPTTTQRPTTTTRSTTERPTGPTTTRDPSYTYPVPNTPPRPDITEEYNQYGERLIFKDEFDRLDTRVWRHDISMAGGGNWEFQLYHNNRTNSFVKDGVLHIKPTLTEERIGEANLRSNYRMDMWGNSPADLCTGNGFYGCERISGAGGNIINPIQSARISTVNSFSFRYGRVEVRAKLPRGDWLWPAIWMLPTDNQYGNWPASGEIDIMESRGNDNYPDANGGGVDSFGSTLHWGVDWASNRYELTSAIYKHTDKLSEDFHTYGLYWSADRLYTYIDDPANIVLDVDMSQEPFWDRGSFPSSYDNPWADQEINAPFNQEYYILINLAVGGTGGYFVDGAPNKPWSNQSPNSVNEFYAAKNRWYPTWDPEGSQFLVDSVKVWQA